MIRYGKSYMSLVFLVISPSKKAKPHYSISAGNSKLPIRLYRPPNYHPVPHLTPLYNRHARLFHRHPEFFPGKLSVQRMVSQRSDQKRMGKLLENIFKIKTSARFQQARNFPKRLLPAWNVMQDAEIHRRIEAGIRQVYFFGVANKN